MSSIWNPLYSVSISAKNSKKAKIIILVPLCFLTLSEALAAKPPIALLSLRFSSASLSACALIRCLSRSYSSSFFKASLSRSNCSLLNASSLFLSAIFTYLTKQNLIEFFPSHLFNYNIVIILIINMIIELSILQFDSYLHDVKPCSWPYLNKIISFFYKIRIISII